MLTPEQLLISAPEYYLETVQNEVFRRVSDFQAKNGYDRDELAAALDCTKRMTNQLLCGSINCSIGKLFDIITRMELCPNVVINTLPEQLKQEYPDFVFTTQPEQR